MNLNAKPDLEGAAPRCRLCSWFCTRVRGSWFCDRCEPSFQHRPLSIEDASAGRNATSTNTMSRDEGSSMQEMDVQVSTGSHSINAGDMDGIASQHYLNGDVASPASQTQDNEDSVPLVSHIVASQGSRDSAEDLGFEKATHRSQEAGSEESWEGMDLDVNDEDIAQGATQSWVFDQTIVGMGQRSNEVQDVLGLPDRYNLIPHTTLDIPVAESELEFSDEMDIEE
ncbi:uncharacterized protein FTOL_04962 [Fusarium torulosum]|uniref:Uncharacterized protein n=1 Tax=Fusarium torulosum TaxID=33205 RepID=A0AAE8M6D8_9HYPO|nr:uncharacterized protein FTOL_04962 [Fusarium torulosum]